MNTAQSWGTRLAASLAVGVLSVVVFWWYWHGMVTGVPDFDQIYYGALAIRGGQNPYAVVGPDVRYPWPTPLYYPLPALLIALPLTWLPIRIAGAVFVGLSGSALGYAIAKTGERWRFVVLGGQSYILAVAQGQWSILFLAAALYAPFNLFAIAKPNVGAIAAARAKRWRELGWPIAAGTVLLAISLVVRPLWLIEWRRALADAPFQWSPVLYPGGALALLALLRWKRPDARYALAYGIIPQTPGTYTDLLLFAIPRGKWEMMVLALLTYVTLPIHALLPAVPTLADRIRQYGNVSTLVLFLPCVAMILLRPKNPPTRAREDRDRDDDERQHFLNDG